MHYHYSIGRFWYYLELEYIKEKDVYNIDDLNRVMKSKYNMEMCEYHVSMFNQIYIGE